MAVKGGPDECVCERARTATMTDGHTDSTKTIQIEVFLRTDASAAVVEPLRETVTRARRLEKRDMIADVAIKTWAPVRPALEELSDSGPSVSRTVDTFRSWADGEGYTLRPAFDRHGTISLLGHQPVTEIRVPTVCVAVYEDDDLQCVAPCSDGDRTYTVEECLTALEAGVTEPFAIRDESVRERSGDRPDTDTRTEDLHAEELE